MSHHLAKRPSDNATTMASSAAKRARDPSSPAFPTNKEASELPHKTRIFYDILASRADDDMDAALDEADIRGVTTADVEQVLHLSYAHPHAAAAFFHWAGHWHLGHDNHSPYSWNLVVDILGANRLFTRIPGCSPLKAFMDDMPRYGMARDMSALNSFLSALCRADRLDDARAAIPVAHAEAGTLLDADSYAILLECCEAAADTRGARDVCDEMVHDIGVGPDNMPAYEAFLAMLVSSNSSMALLEAMYYLDFLNKRSCSPGAGERFFCAVVAVHLEAGELRGATYLWDKFVGRRGLVPDMEMYNTMIMLQGSLGHVEVIVDYLDDMIFNGLFPDTNTYNVFLLILLERRELHKAATIFSEMVKNECWPNEGNCSLALRLFLDARYWETGIRIWSCVVENGLPPLEECGNMLVSKLKDDKLSSSTLSKLKLCMQKIKKRDIYDDLLRKWEAH
ncbi:hypothetical protein BDA96_04G112500 [Sorghum bicolor]|uniref:Pentacotripeptide-repeat region of PRORP domain-containing protein n=1 Tax=Sorghum bicolor TaxID=4558 RepID=A0A921R252_SORBI|nr:hypothetical protein BDA96_04G112500 [Sorghum bicolor]